MCAQLPGSGRLVARDDAACVVLGSRRGCYSHNMCMLKKGSLAKMAVVAFESLLDMIVSTG